MSTAESMQPSAAPGFTRCTIYPPITPSVTLLRAVLLALALSIAMTLFLVPTAEGCPRCEVGATARSQVWNDDFAAKLGIALAPFALIGAVCVGAEAIGRPSRRSNIHKR
jgi:hypothetical protein